VPRRAKKASPWSLSVFEVKLPPEVSPAPPDLAPEHLEPHAEVLLRPGTTLVDAHGKKELANLPELLTDLNVVLGTRPAD
jgi:hypothetical protein